MEVCRSQLLYYASVYLQLGRYGNKLINYASIFPGLCRYQSWPSWCLWHRQVKRCYTSTKLE